MYAQARDRKLIQGTFYNYVDQLLPNFDPLPHRVDNCGHFKRYVPSFCRVTKRELSNDPLPLFLST